MADPASPAEWLRLASQHEETARVMCESKTAAGIAFQNVGFATECALKAYIMRRERFNQWPSKTSRPDLHTHDLRKLMQIADIAVRPQDALAPAWHVVLQWDREQGYDPRPMPRKVARSMVEAAFGPQGIVTWLRQQI